MASTASSVNPQTSRQSQASLDNQKMLKTYSDKATYTHINTISSIGAKELAEICQQYCIPDTYEVRSALPVERMYYRPDRWTVISLSVVKYGVCFPLHSFIVTLLSFIGFDFAQLVPNSYIHIVGFIAFCHKLGVTPTIDHFFPIFVTGRSKEVGLRQVNRQPNRGMEKRLLMKTPTSNKGLHPMWFYAKGPSLREIPNWVGPEHCNVPLGEISGPRMRELAYLCWGVT